MRGKKAPEVQMRELEKKRRTEQRGWEGEEVFVQTRLARGERSQVDARREDLDITKPSRSQTRRNHRPVVDEQAEERQRVIEKIFRSCKVADVADDCPADHVDLTRLQQIMQN
eukprot:6214120-Pleurochrysis_carterae.AAC.2